MTLFESFSFAGKDDTSNAYHFKKPTELGTSFIVLDRLYRGECMSSDFID